MTKLHLCREWEEVIVKFLHVREPQPNYSKGTTYSGYFVIRNYGIPQNGNIIWNDLICILEICGGRPGRHHVIILSQTVGTLWPVTLKYNCKLKQLYGSSCEFMIRSNNNYTDIGNMSNQHTKCMCVIQIWLHRTIWVAVHTAMAAASTRHSYPLQ